MDASDNQLTERREPPPNEITKLSLQAIDDAATSITQQFLYTPGDPEIDQVAQHYARQLSVSTELALLFATGTCATMREILRTFGVLPGTAVGADGETRISTVGVQNNMGAQVQPAVDELTLLPTPEFVFPDLTIDMEWDEMFPPFRLRSDTSEVDAGKQYVLRTTEDSVDHRDQILCERREFPPNTSAAVPPADVAACSLRQERVQPLPGGGMCIEDTPVTNLQQFQQPMSQSTSVRLSGGRWRSQTAIIGRAERRAMRRQRRNDTQPTNELTSEYNGQQPGRQ